MADVALLSRHGLALACIARDPDARLREIAECAGVTERSAHQLVCDLGAAGLIERSRSGRRNHYEIAAGIPADALEQLSPARG